MLVSALQQRNQLYIYNVCVCVCVCVCVYIYIYIPWKECYDQPRQHIKKQRHYFANKGPSSQGYGFSMYGCVSWAIKKAEHRRIDAFECGVGEYS